MHLQRFATRVEIKSVDAAQRTIQGYAAVFGNVDKTGDLIEKGAFDRTLIDTKGDVLVLLGHDASRLPVGEPIELRPDSTGLFASVKVYDTADGNDLLEVARQRMASGKSLGLSIGYRTTKEKWVGGVRHLLDLDLVEFSFLASPALAANPLAVSTGMKARKQAGGTSTLEASYEDLQGDLRAAAAEALNSQWCCVVATYPDHVIVMSDPDEMSMGGQDDGEDEDSTYWDFPYTLGPDGEPVLGEPKPVQPAFVPGAAKARAQHQEDRRRMPPDLKAAWTAKYINDLPDSAFAYIESGGTKDDDGKTTPRSLRHFPHHNADGSLDLPHLRNALARAPQSSDGDKALPHLERHAKAENIGDRGDSGKGVDDAHEPVWAEGVAPSLLVLGLKLRVLADDVAADRQAMERLHVDTKKGARLNATMRKKLKDLHGQIGQILDWAEAIEQGEDGKAAVDTFRNRLRMLELEEVA